MTTKMAPAGNRAVSAFGPVSFVQTARVLIRLAWARTGSPVLVLGIAALLLLPMVFGLVFASRGALSGDPVDFLMGRYDGLVAGLATPMMALLPGTRAFCAETYDGCTVDTVVTTTTRFRNVAARPPVPTASNPSVRTILTAR